MTKEEKIQTIKDSLVVDVNILILLRTAIGTSLPNVSNAQLNFILTALNIPYD